jgi:hypothetical protein
MSIEIFTMKKFMTYLTLPIFARLFSLVDIFLVGHFQISSGCRSLAFSRAVALGLTHDDMMKINEFTEELKEKNKAPSSRSIKHDIHMDELSIRVRDVFLSKFIEFLRDAMFFVTEDCWSICYF